jgi:bacterioferritin-associated ferredoxin
MIVCLCRGVSERTVRATVAQGACTPEAVAEACGAGGDCGSCRQMVQDLIDDGSALSAPLSITARLRLRLAPAVE